MSRWWRKSKPELRQFANYIAAFHADPKNSKSCTPELLEMHRCEHVSAILKTAKDLNRLAQKKSATNLKQMIDGVFRRPYAARTAILISALRKRRFRKCIDIKTLKAFSADFRKLHNLQESVYTELVAKPDGSTRKTYKFGRIRYAQQSLLAWILTETLDLSQRDYALPGMNGIDGAAIAIGDHIKEGCRFWVTTDIQEAFPSTTIGQIRPYLDVSQRLERYVLFARHSSHAFSSSTHKPIRRGLPQGAAHSSLVLSAVVEGCLRASLADEVVAVVYTDNVAIGAQSIEAAKCAYFALKKAFASLPDGLTLHQPFLCDGHFREMLPGPIFDGEFRCVNAIDFCGYRISVDQFSDELHISPSKKAWEKYWSRLEVENFDPKSTNEQLEKVAYERFENWRGGLPLWKPNAAAREKFKLNATLRAIDYLEEHQPSF